MNGQMAGLRVLRVIARLNVGGPARHVMILDDGLRRRGFDTLLAHGDVGPGEATLETLPDGRAVPARRIPGLGRRVSPTSDLRAFVTLVRLVFRFRPDVVHTHTAKAGTLGRVAALLYNASRPRRRRSLVVHTFHGHVLHGYFGPVASALVRLVERLLARATDCVLVLSARQQQEIGGQFRIAPVSRTHVVPLGLELGALLALDGPRERPRAAGAESPIVFGYVGRFVPVKNLPLLIDAFARVHRELPHTRLLMAGDGELGGAVRALIARHRLDGVVRLAGWRHDLAALYREMDVLVLSSLNEGTPVAVIEAMAAGLPVIATAVGGVPDVVTDRETGLLVPSGAVDRMADAMRLLACRAGERARLGAAARASVRERFDAERLIADVSELYVRALHAKRHPRRSLPRVPSTAA